MSPARLRRRALAAAQGAADLLGERGALGRAAARPLEQPDPVGAERRKPLGPVDEALARPHGAFGKDGHGDAGLDDSADGGLAGGDHRLPPGDAGGIECGDRIASPGTGRA